MSNDKIKIFVDSSVLVEFRKQSRTELLFALLGHSDVELFVNSIALSEYTFYLLAIQSSRSPRSVKESRQIQSILQTNKPQDFLSTFNILQAGDEVVSIFLTFMERYNLLPNDALILAYCKINNIGVLASYDSRDFIEACSYEGIILVQDVHDLQTFMQT